MKRTFFFHIFIFVGTLAHEYHFLSLFFWRSTCDCTPTASEGCPVPAEPARTEFRGRGYGQQPHGTSEGRAESAAGPATRCSITRTTSGISDGSMKENKTYFLFNVLKTYVVLQALRNNKTVTQTSLVFLLSSVPLAFLCLSVSFWLLFIFSLKVSPAQPTGGRRRRTLDDDPDERRQRFLERNRAAASRCRQKRKLWVNSLEKKAEELSSMNISLSVSGCGVGGRGGNVTLRSLQLVLEVCKIYSRWTVSVKGNTGWIYKSCSSETLEVIMTFFRSVFLFFLLYTYFSTLNFKCSGIKAAHRT